MTQQDLQRHVKQRRFLPVYFFYGKEEFIIERTAKSLARSALGDGDPSFNYRIFWGNETKAVEIANEANAFPFMSDKRVIIVREADPIMKEEAIIAYVRNPNPDTVLILTASSAPKKSRSASAKARVNSTDIFAYLQSPSNAMKQDVTLEFRELREAALLEWIRKEFESLGRGISREAASLLVGLKGNATAEIASEIQKVITALPDMTVIEVAHIEELLHETRQFDIFELTQAVLSRNETAAQEALRRLLMTDQPGRIIFQLAKDLSILWQSQTLPSGERSSDEQARSLGLASGWQLDKIRAHLPKFRGEDYFEHCFEHLLEADTALKTGAGSSADVILSTLIHRLAHRPPAPQKNRS